jgi:hypothetical protein
LLCPVVVFLEEWAGAEFIEISEIVWELLMLYNLAFFQLKCH